MVGCRIKGLPTGGWQSKLSTVLHYQYGTCEHVVKTEGAAYGNDKAPGLMVSHKEVGHRLEVVPATAV